MKAKFLLILAAIASAFCSCDMDLLPEGQLPDDDAIRNVQDAKRFRNGFYSTVRSFTTSQFFSYSDIQADQFNGLVTNGNRMGPVANGNVLPSESDLTTYWAFFYSAIANTNYFLTVAEPLYEQAKLDDPYVEALYKRYIGEAHFFRGYYYGMMIDRYCTIYDPARGDEEGLGLPIVTVWDPSSDRTTYPGRSSMNTTIKFVKDELQIALQYLSEYEESGVDPSDPDALEELNKYVLAPNAPYVSSWAVRAMQARLAFWLGEYDEAITISKEIINCGIYRLATTSDYSKMWLNDTSTEIIFLPYIDSQEKGNSYGYSWIGFEDNQADYIPTQAALNLYKEYGTNKFKQPNDVRYAAFFQNRTLQTAYGDIATPCFVKFPGNPALMPNSGSNNLQNMPKVFRLSEMYLIIAEAAYLKGDEPEANKYINTFISNRVTGYKSTDYSGTELRDKIRNERTREFIGEGFRISDLRRWQQGFDRANGANYEINDLVKAILTKAGLTVQYEANDHRYTWPIPADELQSNPQIRDQQNPGY